MDTNVKSEYKKIIIAVFRAFIELCEQYGFQYFCCGGTAIGAIRHRGMIPWDDDIDVMMPRPDYDRFLQLIVTLELPGYGIITTHNDDRYYLPFVKMFAKDTTVMEYRDIPCLFGAYIDIFPLDGASPDQDKRVEHLQQFRRTANKLLVIPKYAKDNLRSSLHRAFRFELRTAFNECYYAINKRSARRKILAKLEEMMAAYSFTDTDYVGNYGGMWGIKEFYPKDWFDGFVLVEFEGFQVRLPKEYDLILSRVYGNYMELPPVEDRVSHHNVAYISLTERKTLEEVLILIGG